MLVIAGRRDDEHARVDEPARVEPFPPFDVVFIVTAVYEIARVERQRRLRFAPPRLAEYTRIQALDRILRVAQVQECKRALGWRSIAMMVPLAPCVAAVSAIGIERIGFEPVDSHVMMLCKAIVRFEFRALRAKVARMIREIRRVERFSDLQQGLTHA